jgi:hypothetical protein
MGAQAELAGLRAHKRSKIQVRARSVSRGFCFWVKFYVD